MKALARFGKAFGGYKMIDVPEPVCGPEDVIIEIKAAAICGADMKHYNVDSGSDEFNSVRGHEFAGRIARVGEKVKDWKVGQRVVSDNSGHVCGVCPACEQGDFLCCTEKVNLGSG
ncbi:zinc-type alcohol dehydrogenase [Salmonella enterica subsp. enterica]|nr:zinc-type alcohol dehydrogenase [Salmonella enterica subsp. enterica]